MTRGVAALPGACGGVAGVVAVPGVGSEGVVGVLGDGGVVVGGVGVAGAGVAVVGCPGVIGAGAGGGAPGCAGGVAGCGGAGGWAKSSVDASVAVRIAAAAAITSGRGEIWKVITLCGARREPRPAASAHGANAATPCAVSASTTPPGTV
jgi:hypothetical protein